MKTTKILALILAVLMTVGCLAACTNGGGDTNGTTAPQGAVDATKLAIDWNDPASIAAWNETVKSEATNGVITLKLWGPDAAQDVFKAEAEAFAELFKDAAEIKIEVAVQGEGDAAAQVATDPKAAADVFSFPSDQLNKLVNTNSILSLDAFANDIKAMNSESSVNAATLNDKIWAFPEVGDNSYFLAYDKRVVSADQAKSFEAILEACKTADKKFIMNAGDGFFACMYLYTGGLETLGLEDDGITQKLNDYDVDKVTASVKAFADLFRTYKNTFESGDTKLVADGFKNDPTTVGAGVVGSWNVASVKSALGDNAGFAILPTINIDGTDTQIINMFGYKYLGVNSQSATPFTAQLLASYMTNEACQLERAEQLEWGPANTNAANSDFVKNNESMSAILAQAQYSMPQTGIATTFWNPIGGLGTYMVDAKSDLSTEALKVQVEACISGILDE
ncbi:MAG: extracellular solute-binding protein [Eubacteriales bacterium]|nr:extracellular solute-binding protein [Eubacteriales bacterium]